jgi:hypothetical protein
LFISDFRCLISDLPGVVPSRALLPGAYLQSTNTEDTEDTEQAEDLGGPIHSRDENQKSKVKNRKSRIGNQKSKIGNQKSSVIVLSKPNSDFAADCYSMGQAPGPPRIPQVPVAPQGAFTGAERSPRLAPTENTEICWSR